MSEDVDNPQFPERKPPSPPFILHKSKSEEDLLFLKSARLRQLFNESELNRKERENRIEVKKSKAKVNLKEEFNQMKKMRRGLSNSTEKREFIKESCRK